MKLVIYISVFWLSYKIRNAESNRKFSLLTVRLFLILQSHFPCQSFEFLHVRGARHPMYYGLV